MQVALSPEAEALVEAKIRESGGTLTAEDVVNEAVLGLLPLSDETWQQMEDRADEELRSLGVHGAREVDRAFIDALRARVTAQRTHG